MPKSVIDAENLTRRFGDFVAVDHVSFTVESGEIVGYLGPNGSGKTTTIRMLLGLYEPSEGKATVLGYDAFHESEQVRARCGYMSQKFALYDDLTVWENLVFYGGVYGIKEKRCIEETLSLVGVIEHRHELARGLSAGWRQRLALAIALVHEPKLLFLDEPTSGVDPSARRSFCDLIYMLASRGVSVFVTTHYMDEAEYCGRVGMMREGKLMALDPPRELKMHYVPGEVWEFHAEPLELALNACETCPGVIRVGLAGDHLRMITERDMKQSSLILQMKKAGMKVTKLEPDEPTLEDVFLSLAKV